LSALQILEDIAPEFSGLDQDLLARIESLSASQLKESVFGDLYNYAVALLMAHTLTLRDRQGASGMVTSAREGQLQRSYGGFQNPTQWQSTSYGAELQSLIKRLVVGVTTARSTK
jgi:hypothetical protein